jgi:hypothetical protein
VTGPGGERCGTGVSVGAGSRMSVPPSGCVRGGPRCTAMSPFPSTTRRSVFPRTLPWRSSEPHGVGSLARSIPIMWGRTRRQRSASARVPMRGPSSGTRLRARPTISSWRRCGFRAASGAAGRARVPSAPSARSHRSRCLRFLLAPLGLRLHLPGLLRRSLLRGLHRGPLRGQHPLPFLRSRRSPSPRVPVERLRSGTP